MHVILDGGQLDREARRDRLVGQPVGNQFGDLRFAASFKDPRMRRPSWVLTDSS